MINRLFLVVLFLAIQWKALAIENSPVYLFPVADAHVIQRDDRAVGSIETLDIFGETHVAFLCFDMLGVKQRIRTFRVPFDVSMKFVVNWAPHAGSRLELRRARFSSDWVEWSDETLTAAIAAQAIVIDPPEATYISKDEWVEFDIHNELMEWVQECDYKALENGLPCRWLSFHLSTPTPSWVKVYSKDALEPELRPKIIFSEKPHFLSVPIVADSGVVKQIKDRGFGSWPTLDLIYYTHQAFVEFNLADVLNNIESVHSTTRIKLRLYVEWAESSWSTVTAEVVQLPEALDESEFKWDQTVDTIEPKFVLGSSRVSTGSYVDWDITHLLTSKAAPMMFAKNSSHAAPSSSERMLKPEFRQLRNFQVRLKTSHYNWVKLASKEYYDFSKRPLIVFTQETWWDTWGPVLEAFWTVYWWVITPIHPILVGIALAVVAHYFRKWVVPIFQRVHHQLFKQKTGKSMSSSGSSGRLSQLGQVTLLISNTIASTATSTLTSTFSSAPTLSSVSSASSSTASSSSSSFSDIFSPGNRSRRTYDDDD